MLRIGPIFVIAAFFAHSLLASVKKVPVSRDESEYFEYPAETWIVEQFKGGWVADLSWVFPNERDRRIRPSFLRRVLTDSNKELSQTGYRPLVLVNAIVEDDFVIDDGEVSRPIVFEKCRMKAVHLFGAVFRHGLAFRECNLEGFDAPEEIGNDLELKRSIINGPLNLCESRIHGGIYANDIRVIGEKNNICLSGTVAKHCSFQRCIAGTVSCVGLRAGASVDFSESKFQGSGSNDFSYMTIQGSFSLDYAEFAAPVMFSDSQINGDLSANGATFALRSSPPAISPPKTDDCDDCDYYDVYDAYATYDPTALFASDVRVGGNCYLMGMVSKGPVDLSGMTVSRALNASNSTFEDEARQVSFYHLKVNGVADFSGSTFCSGVDLGNSELGDRLSFDDVTSEGTINVSESRIASYISLDRIKLNENAVLNMGGTKATGLNVQSAVLLGEVNLQEFQSTGLVRFDDTWFMSKAPVNLTEAKAGNLDALRTHFGGGMAAFHMFVSGSMDFTGTWSEGTNGITCEECEVKANLVVAQMNSEGNIDFVGANVGNVYFEDTFLSPNSEGVFDGVTVGGVAVFQYTSGRLTLREGHFNALRFKGIADAQDSRPINLTGAKYGSLGVNGSDQLSEFLRLLRSAELHVSAYSILEDHLKATGRQSDANEVFIDYRRTEAQHSDRPRRVWCWFLDVATGYGRHLERLGWCLIGFVGLGTLVFWSQSGMEPKGDSRLQAYNPFWYSLGLFLPFDNLGISREWVPRSDRWFARHYAHVQQLAGWIIVSIGIGILIGLR